jgi:hypothetical protein
MASDLTKSFDVSRQTPSGQSLEQLRQNYFIEASMSGSDDASIGGLQVNTNGRKGAAALAEKKAQQATNDFLLLAELQRQLSAIEDSMINKYGEDFAEQFAAEYLDEDTFNTIMQIDDPEERRRAFAQAINDGIKNGTIDAADVYDNPDFMQWLDKHDEVRMAENEAKITSKNSSELDIAQNQSFEVADEQDVSSGLDNIFGANTPFS